MPLAQLGLVNKGGDLDRKVEKSIENILSMLDRKIDEIAKKRNLFPSHIRVLQPLHICVLIGDLEVFVILSVHDVGGISELKYLDWSGKRINLQTAIFLVERDLAWQDAFGFRFMRSVLELDGPQKEEAVSRIAAQCIRGDIAHLEKLSRIVRINPIFQGRDFVVDEQLVFVFSPFEEPFNTIYSDHIKPSIESIGRLRCSRADDIYDNQSIIEDIWRYTNEARILISELTGRNPNVFYETGIAHTIGKEVILLTQSMDDVPFDLRHLRCIVYEYTPRGISALESNLKSTVLNILSRHSSQIPTGGR